MIAVWRQPKLVKTACAQCGAEMIVSSIVRRAVYCDICRTSRRKQSQLKANHKVRSALRTNVASEPVYPPANELELADARVLNQLLQARPSTPRANAPGPLTERRCRCGLCRKCLEEARWEAIFQARFADPEYYSIRLLNRAVARG